MMTQVSKLEVEINKFLDKVQCGQHDLVLCNMRNHKKLKINKLKKQERLCRTGLKCCIDNLMKNF